MEEFSQIKSSKNDDEALSILSKCATIAMKQYCPIIRTVEDLEDNIDIATIYKILEYAADITFNEKSEDKPEPVKDSVKENDNSWDKLDLAELESEVFLLGIWKDYEDLETSLSMPELVAILEQKREADYAEKKFLAAMQGVDLDEQTGNKKEDPWEAMKARVFSGGQTSDPNDVLSLQGINAERAGFGIGNGLSYEKW